jgi:predicted TIM-barrel enzyme
LLFNSRLPNIRPRYETDLIRASNSFNKAMPNPWTGKGNPYTRKEVVERPARQLKKGRPIIAAGAGTGISAKFIEKGGADLIIIYNSGRFRMAGRGSTCGLMAYGDANAIAMEIGEHEVLPVVEEIPVICGVHASDPAPAHVALAAPVKAMGFSGVNNFPDALHRRWPVPPGA